MTRQKQPINPPLFTPAGFFMLRAPVLPAQVFTRISPPEHTCIEETDQTDLDAALQIRQENCSHILEELAAQSQIKQALAVASPSLLEGLERLQRGEGSQTRQKRASAGLLRYLIRMSTRPTPFGLFSGVALGTFADKTQAHLASPSVERFRTRPDMQWLLAFLRLLEQDQALVVQLKIRLNQTAYLVGERAVLTFADTYGERDNRTISLRATSVVRKVFELAQQFIPYQELHTALQQAFPRASTEQIDRVLWQLWENHFFISQLHPPLTDALPAEYVLQQLDTLSGVDELKASLAHVLEDATALDNSGIGASSSAISTLVRRQQEMVPAESKNELPLQVDTALHMKSPVLHESIGVAAANIAQFLLSQTPSPRGPRYLQEYRLQFLEKYGKEAEVPLLDLLSSENGLDAPPGYEKPQRAYQRPSIIQPPTSGPRDQLLLQLVIEAVNSRSLEVELTEEIQKRLERWSPKMEEAPLSLEIYLQLHAESREAIDRGEWTAVVGRNCGTPSAGRTFGRFFDLLGEPGIQHLRNLAAREETLQPDVIFAELSYQPWQARLANVAIRPPLRSYEIAVGTTPSVPSEYVISLNDLVVGIHRERFYLRSLRLGKRVRICQTHMLNTMLAPNICRFISEIGNDGLPALSAFDWAAASTSPFLPRLVIKTGTSARLVIAPACWQLQASTISPRGEGTADARWLRGLQHWREQWQVPRYVYLVEGDNRLLLDLEHPLMVAELRKELSKRHNQEQVTLDELLPDFDHLWLRDEQNAGYFSEIVVPLLRTDAVDSTLKHSTQGQKFIPPQRIIAPAERNRFPGEEWTYLKLYAAPNQHEGLLAGPIRDGVRMLQERDLIDCWFFLRYADPEPHIRLRFHVKEPANSQLLLATILPWATRLAQSGSLQRFALDTYEREVERYGGPEAIDLLEQVFMVDSVIVSDIIAFQYARHLTLDPLAVAVFTLNYLFTSWGYDMQQCLAWAHNTAEKNAFSKQFRSERKRYCDLFSPYGQIDPTLAEQRTQLLELLRPHQAFFATSGTRVRQVAQAEKLWVSEDSLLSSLAHMHVNRLLGIDQIREAQVYAFWWHTINSLQQRPDQNRLLS